MLHSEHEKGNPMSKNRGPGRARMAQEDMNLIERLVAGAIKNAHRDHPGQKPELIVSSIAKRLAGSLRGAFDIAPKGSEEGEVNLRAKVVRLMENITALMREHEALAKKKRRQDRRLRVALEALDQMADDGDQKMADLARLVRETE